MYILDGANGDFSKGYQLYLNGEKNVVLTSTNIKMQDYGITETDEVGIVAKSELFNNSPMVREKWNDQPIAIAVSRLNDYVETDEPIEPFEEIFQKKLKNILIK